MSATATLAPLATSNSTVARPMPLPPPVTIIVLPLKSDIYPSNSFLSAFRFHYWNLKRTVKPRSEEHTSELQSLMRISYAVFCLKKKKIEKKHTQSNYYTTPQNYKQNITKHTQSPST